VRMPNTPIFHHFFYQISATRWRRRLLDKREQDRLESPAGETMLQVLWESWRCTWCSWHVSAGAAGAQAEVLTHIRNHGGSMGWGAAAVKVVPQEKQAMNKFEERANAIRSEAERQAVFETAVQQAQEQQKPAGQTANYLPLRVEYDHVELALQERTRLRDQFAAAALTGYLSAKRDDYGNEAHVADACWKQADALLASRDAK
jgi:flagellar biosynthesis GTPase FlhF